MKKIVLFLFIFSLSSFGQVLRPQIITFSNQVQVRINNIFDEDYRCSGFVYARTLRGRTDSHFFVDIAYKRRVTFRTFFIRDFNDRYISAYDSIQCFRY